MYNVLKSVSLKINYRVDDANRFKDGIKAPEPVINDAEKKFAT